MSYQASIHDLTTGRFLLRCSVEAHDLHEAENAAIAKAALAMSANPHEMDVRCLHQRASHRFEMASAGIRNPALTRAAVFNRIS